MTPSGYQSLPDLEHDGIRVGLNWSGKRAVGYDLPVADLIRKPRSP